MSLLSIYTNICSYTVLFVVHLVRPVNLFVYFDEQSLCAARYVDQQIVRG